MSDLAEAFVSRLQQYQDQSPGAMAALRHSLAFEPGAYQRSWAWVEPFAGQDWKVGDARRLALYAVAGLFARNPRQQTRSFAGSLGMLFRLRDQSPGIEARFMALLGADAGTVVVYLRHAASLLASEDMGCDYRQLLRDLSRWMYPQADPTELDRMRQRWAQDFYRSPGTDAEAAESKAEVANTTEDKSKS